MKIDSVDIVCGLSWGDEGKGKIVSNLIKNGDYDWVCRWSGGSNAGHTIYIDGKKYVTHIVPCGVFYNKKSYIGPDCYLNIADFLDEVRYLRDNGFRTDLIKLSPNVHIVINKHKQEDIERNKNNHISTCKGIAPCSSDKFNRKGIRLIDYLKTGGQEIKPFILNEEIQGTLLCEGAQGFWLDINYGEYPYVTSSYTLPYSSCSIGFPPNKIRKIFGACKIYDTRVGKDIVFDNSIKKYNDKESLTLLNNIGETGGEYGTTTGKKRRVNWLDLGKLIIAINISGCTNLIISKTDILELTGIYRLIYNNKLYKYLSIQEMENDIKLKVNNQCKLLENIVFSNNPFSI